MRKVNYLFVCIAVLFLGCKEQATPPKEIYNKDFNWTITIPEGFESVSSEDWTKLQNKGAEAVEKTFNEEVINQSKTIFVFRSDEMNYFESNYQPFDTLVDGSYLETCKEVNNMLYETFRTQMPDAKIDSSSSVKKIDNLEFQAFRMKIEYPNNMVLYALLYSRLFDKKEFSVNIMYMNEAKGKEMLDSWTESKFSK